MPRLPGPVDLAFVARVMARVICIVVIGVLGMVMLSFFATSKACPGLSDQFVASAAVRYAACSKSTDAWSKGGR
jgi:hypothetical protein